MKKKENEFAFHANSKENFRDRLEILIGDRSIRAAAAAWSLPTSTINNYLNKGTEPALKVVMQIANAEGVSLEWLATGLDKAHSATNSPKTPPLDPMRDMWGLIFDTIGRQEAEKLIRAIHQLGVQGILTAIDSTGSLDVALTSLPQEEKERLMALHNAKKGASEECEMTIGNSANVKRKQAVK